jgi:hypothetical protein
LFGFFVAIRHLNGSPYRAPTGEKLVTDLEIWGDRDPFTAHVKGSTVVVDPGRFTFIVTSHYSIDQCFREETDRAALKCRFQEIAVTPENQGQLFQFSLDRSLLRK